MDCEVFTRIVSPEDDVLEWLQTGLFSYLPVLVMLCLIPGLKGRGCEVGYQKWAKEQKRGTLAMKAVCPNYSYPCFALIYHSSHLFLLLPSSRSGLTPWILFPQSTFFFFIPSWQSVLLRCSLPHIHSTHLILLYMSLCPSSWGLVFYVLKFQCTHTSYLLPISSTPVFAALLHKLHSSIFSFSLFSSPLALAVIIKLLPDWSLPLSSPQQYTAPSFVAYFYCSPIFLLLLSDTFFSDMFFYFFCFHLKIIMLHSFRSVFLTLSCLTPSSIRLKCWLVSSHTWGWG